MQGTSSLAEHIEFNAGKHRRRNGEEGGMNEGSMILDRQRQDHKR